MEMLVNLLSTGEIGVLHNEAVGPVEQLRPLSGQQRDIAGYRAAQGVPRQQNLPSVPDASLVKIHRVRKLFRQLVQHRKFNIRPNILG